MSIKVNTYWNMFGSLAPLLIGLITIPILLEALGNEKLGILTLIWALIGYFSIFDFGLGRALTQRISFLRSSNSNDEISLTSKYGMILMFLIGLLGSLIFYVLLNYFSLTVHSNDMTLQVQIPLAKRLPFIQFLRQNMLTIFL